MPATNYLTATAAVATAWGTSGNWSGAAVPANGDTTTVANSAAILDASDQSAVTLASQLVHMTFIGTAGSTSAYLQLSSTIATFGLPGGDTVDAAGTMRWKQNFGSVQTAITVINSSDSTSDANLEPLRFLGTHASNTLNVIGGRVGIATTTPTEVSTILTTSISGGTIHFGEGCTLGTINQTGGDVRIRGAVTTYNFDGGTIDSYGNFTITNFNCSSSVTLNHRKSGGNSVTTLTCYDGAIIDLSQNVAAFAVNSLVINGDTIIRVSGANPGQFTWSSLTQNRGSLTIQLS